MDDNAKKCMEAQRKFCEARNYPMFVPENGQCPYCYGDIFSNTAYSQLYAETRHITGCPHCGKSFCD